MQKVIYKSNQSEIKAIKGGSRPITASSHQVQRLASNNLIQQNMQVKKQTRQFPYLKQGSRSQSREAESQNEDSGLDLQINSSYGAINESILK